MVYQIYSAFGNLLIINCNIFWCVTMFSRFSHLAGGRLLLLSDSRWTGNFAIIVIWEVSTPVVYVSCRFTPCILNMRLHWKWLGYCDFEFIFLEVWGVSAHKTLVCIVKMLGYLSSLPWSTSKIWNRLYYDPNGAGTTQHPVNWHRFVAILKKGFGGKIVDIRSVTGFFFWMKFLN
jgi:hypothetical protein